jgi:hypothetical protein
VTECVPSDSFEAKRLLVEDMVYREAATVEIDTSDSELEEQLRIEEERLRALNLKLQDYHANADEEWWALQAVRSIVDRKRRDVKLAKKCRADALSALKTSVRSTALLGLA